MLKLTFEYDGSAFVGWQVQREGASVQGTIEAAIAELCGAPPGSVRITGAGRTDAGVHARGQVVSLAPPRVLPLRAWTAGLNGLLPPEVACVHAEEAPAGFDARRWACGKRYVYTVLTSPGRAPLERLRVWELRQKLDVQAMRAAVPHLLGRHDFSAFRAADCAAATTVRDVRRLELESSPAGRGGAAGELRERITFTLEATAFLKHMVRNIVGTLVEVGRGRRAPESLGQLLASRDRTLAGMTAPAHGLVLDEVFYLPGLSDPRPPGEPA